ncbi:MAG: hypothetical protein Q8O64_07495, partial [Sideroxyarcus sp.]|nr:hypothetical protein [Sideroxyarcus sp.]
GGQSTIRLWLKTSPQVGTAFPVKRKTLLNLLYSISVNSIIQGRASARHVGLKPDLQPIDFQYPNS